MLTSPLPSPSHPEWVTTEVGKVLNVTWPNAVSRATVVVMDKCLLSVNNSFLSEMRKGRAKYEDYRYVFMRPGLSYFDPYIAPGSLQNIVQKQWMWTILKGKVVEKVAGCILAAYRSFD